MDHNTLIEQLDWDYIRYYTKLLLTGATPRTSLNSKTYHNKDNIVLALQNDICLAIDKRLSNK